MRYWPKNLAKIYIYFNPGLLLWYNYLCCMYFYIFSEFAIFWKWSQTLCVIKLKMSWYYFGNLQIKHLQPPWTCRNNKEGMVKQQSPAWNSSMSSHHLGLNSNPHHILHGLTGSPPKLSLGFRLISGFLFITFQVHLPSSCPSHTSTSFLLQWICPPYVSRWNVLCTVYVFGLTFFFFFNR